MKQFILQAFIVAVFISLVMFFISIIPLLLAIIVTIILAAYIATLIRNISLKQ